VDGMAARHPGSLYPARHFTIYPYCIRNEHICSVLEGALGKSCKMVRLSNVQGWWPQGLIKWSALSPSYLYLLGICSPRVYPVYELESAANVLEGFETMYAWVGAQINTALQW